MYDPWNFGGAKSFIFRGLGGLAPSSPYVEPPLSLFQHPHSTVTLVISIQTNLVTYVKQLVSCTWLSHNHKAPLPVDIVHLSGANFSSPCLVSIYISISIRFQLEHPLAIYSFLFIKCHTAFINVDACGKTLLINPHYSSRISMP